MGASRKPVHPDRRPAVVAGGASYHLQVKVGSISSSGTKQFILQ